jgi:uncharacterized protein YlxW (UPF0749 family)
MISTSQEQGRQRPDASMDLLNSIVSQPIDPDYAIVAAANGPTALSGSGRTPLFLGLVALVIGGLFTVAAVQTTRAAPGLATERQELIVHIRDAEHQEDQLRSQVTSLSAEISRLRAERLGDDTIARQLSSELDLLQPVTGDIPVSGPGLIITVDDAPDSPNSSDQVLDLDLQMLVNGLWTAGAEAVAINGHRVSTLTAIRGAGDAITVGYRSLDRPYQVQTIGDPRTLQARFAETAGGAWWHALAANRGMRYDIASAKNLNLGADAALTLRFAHGRKT